MAEQLIKAADNTLKELFDKKLEIDTAEELKAASENMKRILATLEDEASDIL